MIPIIHTFHSKTAPEGQSAIAFFYEVGKKSLNRLPMVFPAATEEAARKSAEDWWTAEQDKIAKRADRLEEMRKARSKEPT
jgi:hypothetical protein